MYNSVINPRAIRVYSFEKIENLINCGRQMTYNFMKTIVGDNEHICDVIHRRFHSLNVLADVMQEYLYQRNKYEKR